MLTFFVRGLAQSADCRGVTFRDRKVTKRSHSFSAPLRSLSPTLYRTKNFSFCTGAAPYTQPATSEAPKAVGAILSLNVCYLSALCFLPLISTLYRPPFGGYDPVWVLVILCQTNETFFFVTAFDSGTKQLRFRLGSTDRVQV